jgi:ABC-type transporter Mla subunit MlaD
MAQSSELDQALENLAQALSDTLSLLNIVRDLQRSTDRLLVPLHDQLNVTRDAIDGVMRHL